MARRTTSKLHTIQLYQFKNFDMTDFTKRYLIKVNPHEVIDPTSLSVYTYNLNSGIEIDKIVIKK